MKVALNIVLHKDQREINGSPARFKVVKAGKKFGKSWLAEYVMAKWAEKPRGLYWYLAPTYGQAESIAWWDLTQRLIPMGLMKRKLENQLSIELTNGSRIFLKGTENQDRLRGPNLDGVVLDEAAYMDEYVWSGIIRSQLAASRGPAFFISSPNPTGRNWYSNFCDEAASLERQGNKEWAFWKRTIYDNPTLSREEIENIKARTPDETWNLEYMAEESLLAGQKYSEFDYEKHVKGFEVVGDEVYRGIDWGLDHPTAVLWCFVKDGMVWIYDEFCRSGFLISEVVKTVDEKTSGKEVVWTVIDPSANKRDQTTGRSVKDEFLRCGMSCVDGDRRGAHEVGGRGVDIVKMFFKKNRIVIHPKCKNLISELKNLQWGDKTKNDVTDCLRYLLVRLHDLVLVGDLWARREDEPEVGATKYTDEYLRKRREFNLNNKYLFPDENRAREMTWLEAEAMAE